MNEKMLSKFAELVLKIGVNIQEGQGLEIACPTEKADVAVALTKKAYELGARIVRVRWENDEIDKLNYLGATTEALTDIPKWFVDSKNYLLEKGFCYVAIAAENPSAFKDVDAEKLLAVSKVKSKLLKRFSDAVMSNGLRWCVVSVPTLEWAKQVFPESTNPEEDLERAILLSMRLFSEDPVKEWENHVQMLEKRANFLNTNNINKIRFTNGSGTDLTVGLAEDNIWLSAKEKAKDGINFIANMPTEEIFTAPHMKDVNGKVYSAMPLSYNGNIIDDFYFKFKNGKIIDYGAKKGYDALSALLKTDNGILRLGEVALIDNLSPIAKQNILFYNTLFDENASCHLALGKGYPTTIKNGENLSLKELKEKGVNDSVEHVDFMIGSPDICVYGITKDAKEIPLINNGVWVI